MTLSKKTIVSWTIRLAVLGLIVWWLSRGDTWSQLTEALGRLPLVNLFGALGCGLVISTLAGVRWRLVMRAFGAEPHPPVHLLVRGYMVGQFYNLFVPGGIGGEFVRGVITRKFFGTVGTGVMVAFLDRIIGLGSLMAVFSLGLVLGPDLPKLDEYGLYLFGIGGFAIVLVVAIILAARFRRRLEGVPVLGRLVEWGKAGVGKLEDKFDVKLHISDLATPWPLLAAFALSAAMHGMAISVFFIIGAGLELGLDIPTLLVVVPLAIIASMLPIAVAGLGPREAALVVMLGPLGVAQGEALALSLCYWSVLIFIAASGGLVQLLWGIDLPHDGEGEEGGGEDG